MPWKPTPRRGEVYDYDPDPVQGRELGKKIRPCVVVSDDNFNLGPSGLVIIVPLTSTIKANQPLHCTINAPEGGVTKPSAICCEHVRSISIDRLTNRRGVVSPQTMAAVEDILRRLFVL
jgi:mRNA interferase MazF